MRKSWVYGGFFLLFIYFLFSVAVPFGWFFGGLFGLLGLFCIVFGLILKTQKAGVVYTSAEAAAPWMSALILEPGETMIRAWSGKEQGEPVRRYIKTTNSWMTVPVFHWGVLALTNRRTIWVEGQGLHSQSYHAGFYIWLENLSGISHGGRGSGKYVTLTDPSGAHAYFIGIGDEEFPLFHKLVTDQISQRRAALEVQSKAALEAQGRALLEAQKRALIAAQTEERPLVLADGSQVLMERETVKEVQYCSHCGTKMVGIVSFCSNCGGKIR